MSAQEKTPSEPVDADDVRGADASGADETREHDGDSPGESAARAPQTPKVVEAGPPRASFWTRIDRPFGFGFLLTLGALGALVLGMAISSLATVLIYIAFALFAALGLDPAVRFLERRGLSRAWSVLAVIVALIVAITVVVLMILPTVIEQISQFVRSVPDTVQTFLASDFYRGIEKQFGVGVTDLITEVQKFLSNPNSIAQIGGGALQVGASIATGLSGVLIVLVLMLYFVATLPSMKKGLLRLAAARDRENISRITDQITSSVGSYVMGMVVLALANAIVTFVLYLALGLPFPPLMATIAFCVTLIPLVGSVAFWVIGTGIALFTSPVSALIFAVIYVVYMQVEAYVITPRVMNRAISIPGSLVVIGALAGGTLLGLLGALVAVPVTASILLIIKQVWIPRQDQRV